MTPLHIYRALANTTPKVDMTENVFVLHFNNAQREIYNLYGGKYTLAADTLLNDIKNVNDGSNLRDEYTGAITDKIAYLHTGERMYDDGFNNKVQAAYLSVWRDMSKHKAVKPRRRGGCFVSDTLVERKGDE